MVKKLTFNFIGLYGTSGTGEVSDESHLAHALELLGHTVNKVPRDQWKAFCDGHTPNADWVLPTKADYNIIAKWPYFDEPHYVTKLKELSGGPVLYWSWDYFGWPDVPEWHRVMAKTADIHLTNELGSFDQMEGVHPYYFRMDVCDGDLNRFHCKSKYDVVFFGSYFDAGGRIQLLKRVNERFSLKVFSPNWKEWSREGIDAEPAVWGDELNRKIAESKICLQIGVYNDCYGYWSNRVGKVIYAGGFLLAKYVPGIETIVGDSAVYFKNTEDALNKIQYYLDNGLERNYIMQSAREDSHKFSNVARMNELVMMLEGHDL